ncbi:MAG TPA: molecular chaperone HtpG [Kiloniellales bacterium]|nr:molecular chaperone HtpG [Kiloniellales bacterium]
MTEAAPETLAFQAEVSRLIDIVANALYAKREVFLRELISNSSDACDRLRYAALTEPGLLEGDSELAVSLQPDKEAGTLVVLDNGIGMNREELISNLGTIARSGTAKFLEQLGENKGELDLIGQFGVGFYSAFMVADRVVVETRRAGEQQGWRWESDGRSGFTLSEAEGAPKRGTRITLYLKEDAREFLEPLRLREIVKTYSDHLAVPVRLLGEGEPERLNSEGALWTRPKSEISDEHYKEFYRHVAHSFDDPWAWLHFKVEGVMEYSGLLYLPSAAPWDLFDPARQHGVKLYVKRVFIAEGVETLVPSYLRFLRGVIDSEDLPLNVSRETLQYSPALGRMKSALVKRVLGELEKRAEKDAKDYETFWETFGAILKEGLYEESGQQETLLKLARFRSTKAEGWTSLDDYVARMRPGQDKIYMIAGDEVEALRRSPQIEGFAAKDVEVLLLTDPIDEFWPQVVGAYDGKQFQSVTRAGADLDAIEAEKGREEEPEEALEGGELATLIAWLKTSLGDAVKDVRASKRLTSSPVCLVADEGDIDLHLARLLRQSQRGAPEATRVLEINPGHALIRKLASEVKAGDKRSEALTDAAQLLLDQARIMEGEPPQDSAAFARRISAFIERAIT